MLSGIIVFYFQDESPVSHLPWALCDVKIELIRAIKYIFAGLVTAADPDCIYGLVYVLFFFGVDTLMLYVHIFSMSYLNSYIQLFEISSTIFTGIFALYISIMIVMLNTIINA